MIRLTTDLVHFGDPLPLDVYNKEGHLLARAGLILDNESRYRELLDFGYVAGEELQPKQTTKAADPRHLLADTGVLIADDTPLLLDLLEQSLNNLGLMRILRAQDGELAVSKVGQYRPDLVFLDIDMPRRDGISALKELHEEFPNLFICMLSAHSSVDNVRAAISAGASGFLVKPVQRTRLESIVGQFVKKQLKAMSVD